MANGPPRGTSRTQVAELAVRARRLAREVLSPRAAEVDRAQAYPFDNVTAMAAAGFLGMTLTSELGGWNCSLQGAVATLEQVAQACATSAKVLLDTNLGAPVAVMRHAPDAAARQVAARVLAADKPALCVHEVSGTQAGVSVEGGAANDPAPTIAVAHGRHFVINGAKSWVCGGGVSDAHLVVARLQDNGGRQRGTGAFLALRSETGGIEVRKVESTIGTRGLPHVELGLTDVVVPARNLLYVLHAGSVGAGASRNAHEHVDDTNPSLAQNLRNLEQVCLLDSVHGYQLGLAAISIGIAAAAVRCLVSLGGPRSVMAELGTRLQATRSLLYAAAATEDERGRLNPEPAISARARLFASSESVAICNLCFAAASPRALTRSLPLERHLRDSRMLALSNNDAAMLAAIAADDLLDRRPKAGALRDWSEQRRTLHSELTQVDWPGASR